MCSACGCETSGAEEIICRSCRSSLEQNFSVKTGFISGRKFVYGYDYCGEIRQVIVNCKFNCRKELLPFLAGIVEKLMPNRMDGKVYLVPVPSRDNSEARFDHLAGIAGCLAGGNRTQLLPVLNWSRSVRRQVGLSRRDRLVNLTGALCLDGPLPASGDFIVFDDVITTGATFLAAAAVLPPDRTSGLMLAHGEDPAGVEGASRDAKE
ncbi:MAG: hypothetical protein PHQ23_14670 [Candidatus Wallbacteria bacterium]|nr:hypothetical protein [Candidatus Wallbacteria bacterium]